MNSIDLEMEVQNCDHPWVKL